jgi:hypothetical protein
LSLNYFIDMYIRLLLLKLYKYFDKGIEYRMIYVCYVKIVSVKVNPGTGPTCAVRRDA